MLALILNALAYIFTTLYFWHKDKRFSLGVFVFLMYSIFACSGIYCVYTKIFFIQFGYYNLDKISIIPYIVNYFLVLIVVQVIINKSNIRISDQSRELQSKYVNYFEWLALFSLILNLFVGYVVLQDLSSIDFVERYEAVHGGEGVMGFATPWKRILFFRTLQFIEISTPFVYLIEFSKLSSTNKRVLPIVLIVFMYLSGVLAGVITASRGNIVFKSLSLVLFVVLFWGKLEKGTKNLFKTLGIIGVIMVVSYLSLISFSRGGEDIDNATFSVLRYFGESFPNLGLRIWDRGSQYINGMRQFPHVYGLFGDVPDIEGGSAGVYQYYEKLTHFPILNFKTFYGDLYCEFGPFMGVFVFGVYTYFLKYLINYLKGSIWGITIVYYALNTLLYGLFNSSITETNVVNILITFFITVLVRNRINRNKRSQNFFVINR